MVWRANLCVPLRAMSRCPAEQPVGVQFGVQYEGKSGALSGPNTEQTWGCGFGARRVEPLSADSVTHVDLAAALDDLSAT